jgi:hypothetical protein
MIICISSTGKVGICCPAFEPPWDGNPRESQSSKEWTIALVIIVVFAVCCHVQLLFYNKRHVMEGQSPLVVSNLQFAAFF